MTALSSKGGVPFSLTSACRPSAGVGGSVASVIITFFSSHDLDASHATAALGIAVLAELDCYTDDIVVGVTFQTGRQSEQRCERERYRKSATDC